MRPKKQHLQIEIDPSGIEGNPGQRPHAQLLREALDNVDQGVVIVDRAMRVCFSNAKARSLWKLRDDQCVEGQMFSEFIYNIAAAGAYDLPPEELAGYVLRRFETVKSGDPTPIDIRLADGRTIRAQVTPLPSGGRMITHADVSDLISRASHYRQLANVDALTGLPNSRAFLDIMRAELSRFRRYHEPFCVVAIDLDHLKRVNDEFGHDVGDRAILHVASILSHGKRSTDTLARAGGDEFTLLLPGTPEVGALVLVERLQTSVAYFPMYVGTSPVNLSISVGVAHGGDAACDAEQIVNAAGEQLLRNKRTKQLAGAATDTP